MTNPIGRAVRFVTRELEIRQHRAELRQTLGDTRRAAMTLRLCNTLDRDLSLRLLKAALFYAQAGHAPPPTWTVKPPTQSSDLN
jgi:hypothetical protein